MKHVLSIRISKFKVKKQQYYLRCMFVYRKDMKMKEFQLKYGCNPNQKPSRIFMADGQ